MWHLFAGRRNLAEEDNQNKRKSYETPYSCMPHILIRTAS